MAYISTITVNGTNYDIKDAFARDRLSWYGTCTTGASDATKFATCAGYTLAVGRVVTVKFSNTNTAAVASLQLSVNETTSKPIKYKGANLPSADLLASGSVISFLYDGTNYEIIGGVGGGGAVDSVNGKTGTVILNASDVGAVDSVNSKTGTVTLNASDVGAVASNQGSENAGAFLVVNSSGIVEPVEMTAWQGGTY